MALALADLRSSRSRTKNPRVLTLGASTFKSEDYWKGFDTIKDLSEAEKEAQEVFSDLV